MDSAQFRFAHHKLHAWQVAQQLADRVKPLVDQLPPRHTNLGDQLFRSATSTEALIAEGANRFSPKQKRQRFTEARGECGETASHLERLARYHLAPKPEVTELLHLADRICAMLTKLIQRHS